MKRAREQEPLAPPAAAEVVAAAEEKFPWEENPTKYIDGAKAVSLKFVGSLEEANDVSSLPSYPVEFVHQIFEPQGAIACPAEDRPLNLEVVFSATTLDVCYKLDPSKVSATVGDAIMCLVTALPSPAAA